MKNPIGSVYLDAPRRPPTVANPADVRRSRLAIFLAAMGLMGLTLAGLAIGANRVVASPDPFVDAVSSTLDEPLAREELVMEIDRLITDDMLGPETIAAAQAFGVDTEAHIATVAAAVIDRADFRAAVDDLVVELHLRTTVAPSAVPLDIGPLSAAVERAADETVPELARLLPSGASLTTVPGTDIPDVTTWIDRLGSITVIGLLLGLALPAAVAVEPRRYHVAIWTGRWILGIAVITAFAAVGLPYLMNALTGWVTAEMAMRTASLDLIGPAIFLGLVGMAISSFATIADRNAGQAATDEGAAAALGMNDPIMPFVPSPMLSAHDPRGSSQLTSR